MLKDDAWLNSLITAAGHRLAAYIEQNTTPRTIHGIWLAGHEEDDLCYVQCAPEQECIALAILSHAQKSPHVANFLDNEVYVPHFIEFTNWEQ